MKTGLVVGIDPGITTGIAILDTKGNVLDIYSKRDIRKAETISRILKFGNPIIVSSDVDTTPRSIEKIATKLGCIIYSPDTSLSLAEKRELTKDYYHLIKNDHEVDALSAAIKAWRHNRTLFSKVTDILRDFDRQELFSDILLKVMKEESPNIEDAIRGFIEKEKSTAITEKPSKEESFQNDFIKRLEKRLGEKQQEIDSLKNQNILLSKALNETRREVKIRETDTKIAVTKDYQNLEDTFDNIKKLRRIENKGFYPIIEIERVDSDLLEHLDNTIDLDGRVVVVKEKENINLLNNKNIKCLILLDEIYPDYENLEFPVIQVEKNMLENSDNIKAIKIDYIEKRLADAKKLGLVGWLKSYRKRKD